MKAYLPDFNRRLEECVDSTYAKRDCLRRTELDLSADPTNLEIFKRYCNSLPECVKEDYFRAFFV